MQHQRILTGTLLASTLVFHGAWAQEATEPTEIAETSVGTSTQTEASLVAEFSEFLGGDEQAATVVDGLRQGTAFTVGAEAGEGGASTEGTTIEPPTGTMGYGNVRISLKMAESQLAGMGITQPTGEQLQAALLGGEIDGQALDGVLAMRADGMGWGQIAHEYDTTVGQLMGNAPDRSTTTTAGDGTTQVTTASGNGYIPSHPKGGAPGLAKSTGNGYIPSGKGQAGAGIVTGSGAAVATVSQGQGQGHGKGGVDPTGPAPNKHGYIPGSASGGASAVTNAASANAGQGLAKGHDNKK